MREVCMRKIERLKERERAGYLVSYKNFNSSVTHCPGYFTMFWVHGKE